MYIFPYKSNLIKSERIRVHVIRLISLGNHVLSLNPYRKRMYGRCCALRNVRFYCYSFYRIRENINWLSIILSRYISSQKNTYTHTHTYTCMYYIYIKKIYI